MMLVQVLPFENPEVLGAYNMSLCDEKPIVS